MFALSQKTRAKMIGDPVCPYTEPIAICSNSSKAAPQTSAKVVNEAGFELSLTAGFGTSAQPFEV